MKSTAREEERNGGAAPQGIMVSVESAQLYEAPYQGIDRCAKTHKSTTPSLAPDYTKCPAFLYFSYYSANFASRSSIF